MSPHVFKRAEGSTESNEVTDFVHSRIEECMQDYMNKEETVKFLYDAIRINPKFTTLVWSLLEKANPDFFSWFKTHCEKIENASISKSDEDLAEASTSYTEPAKKPIARPSEAQMKKKLQLFLLSSNDLFKETASNDASSQVPQEAATANVGDATIPMKQVSSKARQSKARKKAKKQKQQLLHASQQQQQASATGTAPNVERAEVSHESIPTANAEIILKEISARLGLLESIIQPIHKLLSNGFVPTRSATKALKKQRLWEQVRGDYEQAETPQDPNQQLQQEMQRLDIPRNQANEEDTLSD